MYESIYYMKLTKEQLAELQKRFGAVVGIESRFGGGEYNIGVLFDERVDDVLQWCEEKGIETTLV